MAVSSNPPRGSVTAPLHFYKPPADPKAAPFNYVDEPPEGQPQRNYSKDIREVEIKDIRGREADFTLERDSFQVVCDVPPSNETEFSDDQSIAEKYYPEIEKLLLSQIPGSNRIHIFDHTVRRQAPGAKRSPVSQVHIDQTAEATELRVRSNFPDEAEKLLQGRYRIVNVWRPLNKTPIESAPLAYASASSVDSGDIVSVEHRYPSGYRGHIAAVHYNPKQEWYYLSGMTGDERLLLQCFDSESLKPGSTIPGQVPHTAFEDPRTRPDAEGRESIEIRALVFGP